MSASPAAKRELHSILVALTDGKNEDAKRKDIDPFFRALFPGKFQTESECAGADGHVPGKLVLEVKTSDREWLAGLYQALHYSKKGISFHHVCVLANNFLGLWSIDKLPKEALALAKSADAHKAPNEVGVANARKSNPALKAEVLKTASFAFSPDIGPLYATRPMLHLAEWMQQLDNLDAGRFQINTFNFIDRIDLMKDFFNDPIEAVHCFYAIVGTWDETSIVTRDASGDKISVTSIKFNRNSESVLVPHSKQDKLIDFIKSYFIFTNEGSGLTVDYYFSRFDEVLARIKPEYARQHGIFFTDINISKFALWFIRNYYEKRLGEKYIVVDPAGGSGNLVTSWKDHLKHKIVSELQSDLLKTIERRMRYDKEETKAGYTIIPKTSLNKGLNFLDKSAGAYYNELKDALGEVGIAFDKPIAFLLNPPYKNTDENAAARDENEAEYTLDPGITSLTGDDAGKERYLAFLAQILQICTLNAAENAGSKPLVMIFTPTSWLIPRPTYKPFREKWDQWFKYENGFLTTSNEFFEIPGRWPLAFTIWSFNPKTGGNTNRIDIKDYTHLKKTDFKEFDWNTTHQAINARIRPLIDGRPYVNLSSKADSLKDWSSQSMYDFKRDRTQAEIRSGGIIGGLPIRDERRSNSKTYGVPNSQHIGLMDNLTPVRIKEDSQGRLAAGLRPWFRLDTSIADVNKTRMQNGPTDNRSYCAFDLQSATKTFTWFAMTKAVQGRNPLWSNQMDFWTIGRDDRDLKILNSLAFAFGLAENRCIITKFEADNPIIGAPEVFLDNPMSPNNPDSFWSTTLSSSIVAVPPLAKNLVTSISQLYDYWKREICRNGKLEDVGLENEPYFKYFLSYPNFITPNSGLVQIKKYAEVNANSSLLTMLEEVSARSKFVKNEIYRMLVEDYKYFE